MLRREIYSGVFYRVRDYGEMLSDPKLKAYPDGSIIYPRSSISFTPSMKHLCGKAFMADGFRHDGSIFTYNRNFKSEDGIFYRIAPWMVESNYGVYQGKTYDRVTESDESDIPVDTEKIGMMFADLFGR